MNTISETIEDKLTVTKCSCGAICAGKNGLKRFKERHPKMCSERRAFAKLLAGRVNSVEVSQAEDVHKFRAQTIAATGRGLTAWEHAFMKSIAEVIERYGSGRLTQAQQDRLERIYLERTPN